MTSVLFETHHLYYLPNFLPIIDELKLRGGYSISASIPRSISDDERGNLREAVEAEGLEFIDADNEMERQTKLTQREFDVVIVGIPGMLKKVVSNKSLAVMVYHGIGLKQSYYRDTSSRIDIRAVESRSRYEELIQRGETNLVLTGYTKIDPLSHINLDNRNKKLEFLKLKPDRRTILYAPTFYPSSVEKLLPQLPRLAKEFNVIIKLHGFSWSQRRYRHHNQIAQQIAGNGIYLVPFKDYNIVPYYAIADALISDISSTLFEYLATDRPIIQTSFTTPRLKHRIFSSRLTRRLDRDRSGKIDFSYLLKVPEEVLSVVKSILEGEDTMSSKRRQAAGLFLHQTDGKASSRLVDYIEERLI